MRFILVLLALLGVEMFAAQTVQDDVCTQGDCQEQTVKQTTQKAKNSSAAKTEVDENGLVSVADKSRELHL